MERTRFVERVTQNMAPYTQNNEVPDADGQNVG